MAPFKKLDNSSPGSSSSGRNVSRCLDHEVKM